MQTQSLVTTHVSAWFGRGERPRASGVSPIPAGPEVGLTPEAVIRSSSQVPEAIPAGPEIGLTPEAGGSARLNHALTCVVTAFRFSTPEF